MNVPTDLSGLGMQQCYSVASAQRRSRTTDGGLAQGAGEDGQQSVMHLENGVPVYQDMSMNMQVQPSALLPQPVQTMRMMSSCLVRCSLLGSVELRACTPAMCSA